MGLMCCIDCEWANNVYLYHCPEGRGTYITCDAKVSGYCGKNLLVCEQFTTLIQRKHVVTGDIVFRKKTCSSRECCFRENMWTWLIMCVFLYIYVVMDGPQQVILWVWGLLYVTMTELSFSLCAGFSGVLGLASHTMVALVSIATYPLSLFTYVWPAHVSASPLISFLSVCQELRVCICYICLMSTQCGVTCILFCLLMCLSLVFFVTLYIYIYIYIYTCMWVYM